MSFTGQEYPNQSAPGFRDPRALSEEEWRASLPSFGQQLGTGLRPTDPLRQSETIARANSRIPSASWDTGPVRSNTAWVWCLIATPFVGSAAAAPVAIMIFGLEHFIAVARAQDDGSMAASLTVFVVATTLTIAALVLLFAVKDRSALRRLGHEETAAPWLAPLWPLLYLVVRTTFARRQAGSGAAPLVVYLVLQLGPPALGVAAAALQAASVASGSSAP
ncbi:hypothetical protein FVA74_11650 [Salinibacterium sp. dk2585]|uniref:hypothetical protein n=1 Tax=unclassified Salinibacterium TaxID=2632331 RepID=UPI0011C2549F|nr:MULTISPECIES: hypothetical protein [unclassified Salinibacterium]QEE62153.1 hypothetical protein FVA74_11650 [Salinibacterium sp. dk2585]TXK53505.1 hypothetical protein FVP63_09920 [Salinibacterium sp. dk5596]